LRKRDPRLRGGDVVVALLSLVSAWAFAAPPLPLDYPAKTLGAASCASSLCHGSVTPWSDGRIRQDEYVLWSRHDPHARSYERLLNPKAKDIAQRLGLKNAHEANECLDCHTHNVPPARRGEGYLVRDGIQCEACHGPAQRWMQGHADKNAKRGESIARGLFPTRNPARRAELCLSCHFGNEQKLVTHRMMAAGHPRLAFEFDTFTHLQPPHYGGAAGAAGAESLSDGARNWALGQALMADTLLGLLVHPQRGRDGFFPELVLFDCHACHHPMSKQRNAGARLGVQPGAVRLNDANLLMVRHIARRVAPQAAEALAQASRAVHATIAGGGDLPAQVKRVRGSIGTLIPMIEKHRFSADDLHAILAGLIDDGLAGQYSDYQGAEQAAMGLQAVADFLSRRKFAAAAPLRPAMQRVMAAVKDDEAYRPDEFTAALRELRIGLGQARMQ
jgi:hypothetical protein